MYNENNTLSPAEIELLSNVAGAYSSPFLGRNARSYRHVGYCPKNKGCP